VFVGVGVQNRDETHRMVRSLQRHGLKTVDLSDDELAKLHVRHLVGGRMPHLVRAPNELLYRFEFPERPGALANFLDALAGRWNISLFHYRNHGSDFGRVLAGLEVEDRDLPAFQSFLEGLGYEYAIESDNPAYRFFLG
jgi:threonine dehydratase